MAILGAQEGQNYEHLKTDSPHLAKLRYLCEVGVDVMTIVAHPDDAELGAGGTLMRWRHEGARIAMVELTAGQLGTRGTPEQRWKEAMTAAQLLKPVSRLCLGWEDGFFAENPENLKTLIDVIRRYQPKLVITNALSDRHPDHSRAAQIVERAAWLSGLRKIVTHYPPHRPRRILFMIQDRWQTPSIVVDISDYWEAKLRLISAYRSQFFREVEDKEPETYLTRPTFFPHLEARAREMGHFIGVAYGEGFVIQGPLSVPDYHLL